ncbi:sensor domain-containing diguanylate cyclase [Rhizobium rosettiformans]|uniref:sensor domain-containing diguanylate cyclase n=1 Tax=Rhizobium rosettiformans TaxID=1368430 RepID=UPI00285503B4|nr:sensor domain-containing diguanylate cyclase [Rhizobium rosettiformans]MDR7031208.1 diguanylate cyclase (GGDEF)-like protein [Rhizobium rosettiformans]MDR7067074.1 diguanylate cyclase (GGDEF)-like protein [Rhizobium rosettiformans]
MVITRPFGKLSAEAVRKEAARLQALEELDLLDSPRDPGFDRFVRLIQEIFSVEIGIVSFIDGHRQWYKASAGMSVEELPRQDTFCRYVLDSEDPLIVQDASLDERFSQHPVVLNPPHIRFYAGFPLKTDEGLVVGTICAIDSKPGSFGKRDMRVFEELAGAVMDRVTLATLAATDALTGLMSRRSFKDEADRLISQALRHHHEVSCIMLDVDHFKSINDRFGHQTGDEVLKAVASTCKMQLRAGDLLGRLGGEEFAIILPHVGREGALATAEKLRQAVASAVIDGPAGPLSVTASFGVTATSIIAKDVDTLLSQADAAMYRAKETGRNRCEGWGHNREGQESGSRRRVLKSGRIIINDRRSTIDCTIRSIGADGANIAVSDTSIIPANFILSIEADGIETTCRIISQNRQAIEVAFA